MMQRACPILPVRNIEAALALFARLGFQVRSYGPAPSIYGFIERDGVQLHLALAPTLIPEKNTSAVYLYVQDPDALYEEWRAAVPDGRFDAPENKPWGVREMVYVDPDSNLFRIGVRTTP
jgi:catechol 2,3-dioxygenase-like lactoylglutathione lyase family enzyme